MISLWKIEIKCIWEILNVFFFSLAFLSTWPWLWLSGVSDAWIDSDTCYHGISSGELRQVSSLSVQQKILQQSQCLNTKGISKFIYYALNTSRTKKDLKPSSFFQNVVKMLFLPE